MAWTRQDGSVAVAIRSAAGAWGPSMTWSQPGDNATAGPAIVGQSAGTFALSYVSERAVDDLDHGELRVVAGDAQGVATRALLARAVVSMQGAGGDFATLAALPEGHVASALAVYDPAQRAFHVEVFTR